jgi:hypothetical protein
MRISTGLVALALIGTSVSAQNPTRVAAPSTRANVTVNLTAPQGVTGVTPAKISIDYGQPHLRGRKIHTPGLVPLDTVWRLGANEATVLETTVDIVLGGHRLPAGKYSLYALPRAAGWQLIINANTGQWGTDYVEARDVARVNLTKRTLSSPVEAFSIWLVPSRAAGAPSGEFKFAWGDSELTTEWRVP